MANANIWTRGWIPARSCVCVASAFQPTDRPYDYDVKCVNIHTTHTHTHSTRLTRIFSAYSWVWANVLSANISADLHVPVKGLLFAEFFVSYYIPSQLMRCHPFVLFSIPSLFIQVNLYACFTWSEIISFLKFTIFSLHSFLLHHCIGWGNQNIPTQTNYFFSKRLYFLEGLENAVLLSL